MSDDDMIGALHSLRVETGSLACLGCGHEHNCSIHGCAIIRAAEDLINRQAQSIADLQAERDVLLTSTKSWGRSNPIPVSYCKHGIGQKRNEIGEDEVYCELNSRWMNVTIGDCLGNCESESALDGGAG